MKYIAVREMELYIKKKKLSKLKLNNNRFAICKRRHIKYIKMLYVIIIFFIVYYLVIGFVFSEQLAGASILLVPIKSSRCSKSPDFELTEIKLTNKLNTEHKKNSIIADGVFGFETIFLFPTTA